MVLWSGSGFAVLSRDRDELTIVDWAAVEESAWPLMDAVVAEANALGCTRLRGEYVATGANETMREYLAQFGFTMMGEDEGATYWILPVSAYQP